ncbi:ribosomal protein S18 acetylase RimI-like enzyme [Agromyces terreus]|uniref:Ribosomal protein S18 acetylase RimI-like enzyme n=1 Tax=Agromyces terreus TaxID=424795 RepID=A0A9X2KCV6_9MICO|nr:GNAT family N-acetyltransferase [Agromyces terreus]MCP2372024.1 ribosomal protein S18 acetylase RimI-like enzyme [Agromyces terreus]
MTYEIRRASEDDFFGWLPLFEAYCRFYETELDDAKALIVWNWISDEHDPLQAALAVSEEGTPVGLAHYRVVPDSLSATRGMHLDDLYVDEESRGSGIGTALIRHVHERAGEVGAAGVSWITAADNESAQRLYDSLAARTTWVTYEMGA